MNTVADRRHDAELRLALASRTETAADDWYIVFKARYGMAVVLQSVREVVGQGSVLTQSYTCCTAIDPILVAGLTPTYADVAERSASLDPERLTVLPETRAVVLQHTYGLLDEGSASSVANLAHAKSGVLLLEDCAHCVARMSKDADGMPLADVSIHSFGVEKMLPTRFGGAVWVNPHLADTAPEVNQAIRARLLGLAQPSTRLGLAMRLYVNENRVLSRLPALMVRPLRHWLSNIGCYEPAISATEQEGGLSYEPLGGNAWIVRKALAGLAGLDANEALRIRVVEIYRNALAGLSGLSIPSAALQGDSQPLLRFPLFAVNTEHAEELLRAVREVGGYAERWYRPELFPGVTDPNVYAVPQNRDGLRITDSLVAGAVCLPTQVSVDQAQRIVDAICRSESVVD